MPPNQDDHPPRNPQANGQSSSAWTDATPEPQDGPGDAMEPPPAQDDLANTHRAESPYASADFDDLRPASDNGGNGGGGVQLESLLDIPVTISMELGRTKLPISHLLKLNQGSVIALDRLAGEPMDVLVNGCLIAHGEVVVVNDKFGIRLTDVISKRERMRNLRP